MRFSSRKPEDIDINDTSLIDVVLLLLIFFMLQSSFVVPHGMDLKSEKKEKMAAGATSKESAVIYIELHKDGGLWLDGERRDLSDLPGALPVRSDKSVIVASDPGVPLQRAVDVIDVLNAQGLTKVSLREARQFK